MAVEWIGYRTESERVGKVTIYTFVTNYVNIAVLLLLGSADLSEQPLYFAFGFGSSPDFDSSWFETAGILIVSTMIINMIYPLIELGGYWLIRIYFRN
jgi:hypothetical protein